MERERSQRRSSRQRHPRRILRIRSLRTGGRVPLRRWRGATDRRYDHADPERRRNFANPVLLALRGNEVLVREFNTGELQGVYLAAVSAAPPAPAAVPTLSP
jgi:hypothetical protein